MNTAYHPAVIRRLFLAPVLLLWACQRTPEKIVRADAVDAAPAPSIAPAPQRPLPNGHYSSENRARIELRVDATFATLTEHLETERAPLIATGPYTSTMERDGSFTVTMTVKDLKKEFLSRCLDCKSKDVHETLDVATFDGHPIAKGATTQLLLTFSDGDRFVEMCFMPAKKCARLKRG